jgi:hypothetical protein
VPGVFVISLILASALGVISNWLPLMTLLSAYAAVATGFTVWEMLQPNAFVTRRLIPVLPGIFFFMHMVYGIGTCIGLVKMPWFWFHNRNYILPRPISPPDNGDVLGTVGSR